MLLFLFYKILKEIVRWMIKIICKSWRQALFICNVRRLASWCELGARWWVLFTKHRKRSLAFREVITIITFLTSVAISLSFLRSGDRGCATTPTGFPANYQLVWAISITRIEKKLEEKWIESRLARFYSAGTGNRITSALSDLWSR